MYLAGGRLGRCKFARKRAKNKFSAANLQVGLDVHEDSIDIALAEAGRNGELRHNRVNFPCVGNNNEVIGHARKSTECHSKDLPSNQPLKVSAVRDLTEHSLPRRLERTGLCQVPRWHLRSLATMQPNW